MIQKKLCSKIISVFFKKERAMSNLGKLLARKNGETQTKKTEKSHKLMLLYFE